MLKYIWLDMRVCCTVYMHPTVFCNLQCDLIVIRPCNLKDQLVSHFQRVLKDSYGVLGL